MLGGLAGEPGVLGVLGVLGVGEEDCGGTVSVSVSVCLCVYVYKCMYVCVFDIRHSGVSKQAKEN